MCCTPELSENTSASPTVMPYAARGKGSSSNLKLMVSRGSLLLMLNIRDAVCSSQLDRAGAAGCRMTGGRDDIRRERQAGGDGHPDEANAWRQNASSRPVSASEGG